MYWPISYNALLHVKITWQAPLTFSSLAQRTHAANECPGHLRIGKGGIIYKQWCMGPVLSHTSLHPGTLQYLQGKKKGLIKLRSIELYPEHAHAPPASCSQTPLAHEQRVFKIRPCWLRMSSHGPFPAWFLGLGGKPGINIGLLLVQMVRLYFLALETINNPLKTKKHLSILGNFGRSGFHKPNAFQMFFFLMPNVSYMILRHPVFTPGQMWAGLC